MKILSVIPLKKGVLKGNLTYFSSLDIPVGNIVSISLRNKKELGLVVATEDLSQKKSNVKNMNFNLKKINETKGSSIFLPEYLESIFDVSNYFAKNRNNAIASLIPRVFIEKYDEISKTKNETENNKKNDKNLRVEKLLFQYPLKDRMSIYKTLIRESFAKRKSIFIVLPTELDIKKFEDFLARGVEQFTFSLHSGNSAKKTILNYKKIITSKHPLLIIGTAPYLSMPKNNIGTIILEQENSSAYKMIAKPFFDLRIFTEVFASKIGAKLIIADNLLRFETLARKEIENINTLHPLSYRVDSGNEVMVLGKNPEKEKGGFQILKRESLEEIKNTLKNKQNVFIFSLRKGLATITTCKDCGNNIVCENCNSTLVLYSSKDETKKIFICNKCGKEKDTNITCDVCGSWNLMPLGIGTDTVYEYTKKILPKIKIFKLDKESAKTKKGAENIIKEFENSKGAILIGTEMALLYMSNKIPLSVIASFDSLWSIPNFRIAEKILKILLTINTQTEGKFIIQAKNETDGAILAIQRENFLSFIREELEDRKVLGYPPFKRFIKITFSGNKTETSKAREVLKELFKDYHPEIFSGFIPKTKDKYSTNLLLKLETKNWSLPALFIGGKIDEVLLSKLMSLPRSFQVSVDPEDLL
ncbi:hypothetical protein COU49_02910 [Candidatus Nomurabacteria bacterium CG10_big_fil_rev_8_21_14_0_10_35_16]|uniref:Primosomal protein N' 3' DNA-binding domain-containing protein n=1 Tax=Candidatus Nomurabacteria bacterium CG10_big_fil_rev_8_21_14_0_10_35_16 TaxID=1974731 RepID=A0A2H0TAT6_9BACT|nr:MAG: hypothetical protein COU49_02910 [Candidatus Nomurabacteria bacterium CG10_big_fil_rev_8_21_14_0_10_35_16]